MLVTRVSLSWTLHVTFLIPVSSSYFGVWQQGNAEKVVCSITNRDEIFGFVVFKLVAEDVIEL